MLQKCFLNVILQICKDDISSVRFITECMTISIEFFFMYFWNPKSVDGFFKKPKHVVC